jgi:hypothetical protein
MQASSASKPRPPVVGRNLNADFCAVNARAGLVAGLTMFLTRR